VYPTKYISSMQHVVPAHFYRVAGNGPEPVKEWLRSLSSGEKQKIGRAIRTVELGWPVNCSLRIGAKTNFWEDDP